MSDWINDLKKEFGYCDKIQWVPFPSVTPEFMTGYRLICALDNKDVDKEKCKQCIECSKCDCYHEEEKERFSMYSPITGEKIYKQTKVGVCWGTRECEECNCKGNKLNCDFY